MKSLARIDAHHGDYVFSGLLLVDFGDNDVSMFKDVHGIIHLERVNGKLVIKHRQNEEIELVVRTGK